MEDLSVIKGIGPKTRSCFIKLGINTINDLINHYPFRYEILKRSDIFLLKQDDHIVMDGFIDSFPSLFRFRGNMNKMSFRLRTSVMIINVTIFNRGFLKNLLSLNKEVIVIGKWDMLKNTIVATDIKFGSLGDKTIIEPIYHTTNGLSMKMLGNCISEALKLNLPIIDYIPYPLVSKYHFIDKKKALIIIHQPLDVDDAKRAMIRLKYEELFLFMLKINFLKSQNKDEIEGHAKNIDNDAIKKFINNLPFKLTHDQMSAIDDIMLDIKSNRVMNRLLQGDVGSGKTVVAVVAIYAMYLNHYQSALMVPTEILASQHYDNIRQLFKGININIKLLTGYTSKKEKASICRELSDGKIDVIIGTHAIIQDTVSYQNLGLVITDEQHR
ncbi:MAG: DEAD/DEAH box helicase, partial [Bacilli bacterium]